VIWVALLSVRTLKLEPIKKRLTLKEVMPCYPRFMDFVKPNDYQRFIMLVQSTG